MGQKNTMMCSIFLQKTIWVAVLLVYFTSCRTKDIRYDASGTFESKEIILSSEANGRIVSLPINEGDNITAGQIIGAVDSLNLSLQKEQVMASVNALELKQNSANPQVTVLNQQLILAQTQLNALGVQMKVLKKEQGRMEALFAGGAATSQQLDDINGKVDILEKQIGTAEKQLSVVRSQILSAKEQIKIQNRGITSERIPLEKRMAVLADQINKTLITSAVNGTVLTKYAEEGEFVSIGKPILKVADLREMVLRLYITGSQLSSIKIGDTVAVYVDNASNGYDSYTGKVSWISDKAEFTPKTIQTKDERANLVYAVKVIVKNDGKIKIGMYGEVEFMPEISKQ